MPRSNIPGSSIARGRVGGVLVSQAVPTSTRSCEPSGRWEQPGTRPCRAPRRASASTRDRSNRDRLRRRAPRRDRGKAPRERARRRSRPEAGRGAARPCSPDESSSTKCTASVSPSCCASAVTTRFMVAPSASAARRMPTCSPELSTSAAPGHRERIRLPPPPRPAPKRWGADDARACCADGRPRRRWRAPCSPCGRHRQLGGDTSDPYAHAHWLP